MNIKNITLSGYSSREVCSKAFRLCFSAINLYMKPSTLKCSGDDLIESHDVSLGYLITVFGILESFSIFLGGAHAINNNNNS